MEPFPGFSLTLPPFNLFVLTLLFFFRLGGWQEVFQLRPVDLVLAHVLPGEEWMCGVRYNMCRSTAESFLLFILRLVTALLCGPLSSTTHSCSWAFLT